MVTIELKDLILHGYHGVYEEEKKVMNTFEVSLSVKYDEIESDFSSIHDTISYVDLHHIVKQKFQVPALLLEKIGQEIIRKIKEEYPMVKEIEICIFKAQAPIENFQGKVGVTLFEKFEE